MPYTTEQKRQYNKRYSEKNKEKILERKRQHYSENRDQIREAQKRYYANNKEAFTSSQRAYYSTEYGRKVRMWSKAKERAEKTGLEFNISVEDIILPVKCPYLGVVLTHDLGKGQLSTNSSLDRIDSKKGYVVENIQVISRLANTMKSNATEEQLIVFARNILDIHERNLISTAPYATKT